MTPLAYVLLGLVGGIFVTAPLGPVNVMIMQRAFRYGFLSGAFAGFGASAADVLFASLAAFSITTVRTFVEGNSQWIQLVGGTLVFLFGVRILLAKPAMAAPVPENGNGKRPLRSFGTTFALTITNPATIFGFIAYFGALGDWGPDEGDWLGIAQMLLGVLMGTLAWWCGLAALVTRLRVRFTDTTLSKVNMIAGVLLLAFGAGILGRLSVTYLGLV